MWQFIGGYCFGTIMGICIMCIFQMDKEEDLKNKKENDK